MMVSKDLGLVIVISVVMALLLLVINPGIWWVWLILLGLAIMLGGAGGCASDKQVWIVGKMLLAASFTGLLLCFAMLLAAYGCGVEISVATQFKQMLVSGRWFDCLIYFGGVLAAFVSGIWASISAE